MTIMHWKKSIMKKIMKFTNFNDVNENYGKNWICYKSWKIIGSTQYKYKLFYRKLLRILMK